MAQHLQRREYLQRDPEGLTDLWLEVEGRESDNPKISFFCNVTGKKHHLLSIGVATAVRLVKALNGIVDNLESISEKVWEPDEDDNDPVCDNR